MPDVCPGCGKLIRHCKCGRFSKESRHFDGQGNEVEDNSLDKLKKDMKDTAVEHFVDLGHDLLDRVGDELIGKKKDGVEQGNDTKLKKCVFCGEEVKDLSKHTCKEKDENVVEAEFEVVEGEDGREQK